MYSKFQLSLKFLNYYLSSSNGKGHGTHSPFVFDFIARVLNDRKQYPVYETVEQLRRQLSTDQTLLAIEDMGAGSAAGNSTQRSVASIARNAAKPRKYGQLLFRMVKHYQPATILDLGTSLGITTCYLAAGDPAAKVVTLEGANEVAELAMANFKTLKLENIELIRGDFKYGLPVALKKLEFVDLAFIDGNHRREATENYFHQLLERVNNDSILIFDDIHWSPEMEQAWHTIKQHSSVTCSIDLFFIGFVLLRKEFKEKQHFQIRF
jgi:predicted O-methyltransferase YrrM